MEPSKLYSFFLIAVIVVWCGAAWWTDNKKLFRTLYNDWKARRRAKRNEQTEALCQCCLAVKVFPDYESAIAGGCDVCTGYCCPCLACCVTIRDLENGVRDKERLGLTIDIEKWNPKTGIR